MEFITEYELALCKLESLVDEAFKAYIEEYDDPRHPQFLTYYRQHWPRWSVYAKMQFFDARVLHPNAERATKLAFAFAKELNQLRIAIAQGDRCECELAVYKLREIAEF